MDELEKLLKSAKARKAKRQLDEIKEGSSPIREASKTDKSRGQESNAENAKEIYQR